MNETLLITTSSTLKETVRFLQKSGKMNRPCVRWLHLEFGDRDKITETDGNEAPPRYIPGEPLIIWTNPSLWVDRVPDTTDTDNPNAEGLRIARTRFIRHLIDCIRLGATRDAHTAHGDFSHILISGTFYDHASNLLSLYSLKAARQAARLLAGNPGIRVNLLGTVPTAAHHVYEDHAVCLGFLEAISPRNAADPGQDGADACKSAVIVQDVPPGPREDENDIFHDPVLCNAIEMLVSQIGIIDRQRIAAGPIPGGSRIALYGFADLAYRPADYLQKVLNAGGPDFRELFLLRPLETEKKLSELRISWRAAVDEETGKFLDWHQSEWKGAIRDPGFEKCKSIPETNPAEDFQAAYHQCLDELNTDHLDIRKDYDAICGKKIPEFEARMAEFEKWLTTQWDRFINKKLLFLPGAADLARELHGGSSLEPAAEPISLSYTKDTARKCRGGMSKPLDALVKDPTLQRVFEKNENIETYFEKIAASDELAVKVRMGSYHRSPSDGEPEDLYVDWIEEEVTACRPLRDGMALFEHIHADLENRIKAITPPKTGLFSKRKLKEAARKLQEEKKDLIRQLENHHRESLPTLHSLIVTAYPQQVPTAFFHSWAIGGWTRLRRVIEKLRNEVVDALENIRCEFERVYETTSSDIQQTRNGMDLAQLLIQRALNVNWLENIVTDTQAVLEENRTVFLSGAELRKYAENRPQGISDLIPSTTSERLPWNIEQALLKPIDEGEKDFFKDVIYELVDQASRTCAINASQIQDWTPAVLPFFSTNGGEQSRLSQTLRGIREDRLFWDQGDHALPWVVLDSKADDHVQLHFICFGVALQHLDRTSQLFQFAEEYRARKKTDGEPVVPFMDIYADLLA